MARKIDLIVIHCSASEWGSKSVIDEWHKQRGWDGVGYHFVITNGHAEHARPYVPTNDGCVQRGRAISTPGAHAKGYNKNSIGVCLIGVYHFTGAQFRALTELLQKLMKKYKLEPDKIVGHYELDTKKTCPNFDVDWLRSYFRNGDK